MDWLSSVRAKAQEAVNTVVNSETAGRARQLAQQASQQAAALAKEATVKAQEVAKEALGEAEKSLQTLRQGKTPGAASPAQYGITPELEQFVRSLTYSTFSDWPLDTLDIPHDTATQRLTSWQEKHARLILQQVPQLQDLRFVLSPKRMNEYTFWMIYFTLCKRYLPTQEEQVQQLQHQAQQPAGAAAGAVSPAVDRANSSRPARSTGLSGLPLSASGQDLARTSQEDAIPDVAIQQAQQQGGAQADAAGPPAATGSSPAAPGAGSKSDDELVDLDDDPGLDAYLQDALQLDDRAAALGGESHEHAEGDTGDGSDIDDLDDYINKLDAEVSAA